MEATVFEIKKFAVHDGDGIRTTVFLKGCSLSCVWCHNPEGISFGPQLAYNGDKCANCGACTAVEGCTAHCMTDGKHSFCREKCTVCGRCESVCPRGALYLYGKRMSVEEIFHIVAEDKEFYDMSGGGVTLSGGECLCQADFCAELLKLCKQNGINTAVDTAGNVPRENIAKVMPYTDVFLYDLKHMDSHMHRQGTGADNRLILDNLRYISDNGGKTEIRIPVIPGYNEDCIREMGDFIKSLSGVRKVRFLEYHDLAKSKYSRLGIEHTMPPVQKGITQKYAEMFQSMGIYVEK